MVLGSVTGANGSTPVLLLTGMKGSKPISGVLFKKETVLLPGRAATAGCVWMDELELGTVVLVVLLDTFTAGEALKPGTVVVAALANMFGKFTAAEELAVEMVEVCDTG